MMRLQRLTVAIAVAGTAALMGCGSGSHGHTASRGVPPAAVHTGATSTTRSKPSDPNAAVRRRRHHFKPSPRCLRRQARHAAIDCAPVHAAGGLSH
jgi:hypothetical protein